jgi:hypothetical protein
MQGPSSTNGAVRERPQDIASSNGSTELIEAQTKPLRDPSAAGGAPEVQDAGSPYVQAGFSAWRRTLQIYAFALTFAFRYWRLGKASTYRKMTGGMTPENVSAKKAELARWLREGLIKLGPTFIKIGQQFSTRVDVLSREFIAELELLQDKVRARGKGQGRAAAAAEALAPHAVASSVLSRAWVQVPAFGARAVRSTIEEAFGKPVEELFEEFDFTPLAAASLGQVHLAKLNGRRVVVKVQRPGLRELFAVDLKNVRVIAQWLQVRPRKRTAAAATAAMRVRCGKDTMRVCRGWTLRATALRATGWRSMTSAAAFCMRRSTTAWRRTMRVTLPPTLRAWTGSKCRTSTARCWPQTSL